ncbi:MAG: peptide chain release factor N(5)-glutamine methyltransferase [Bacteroidales bacterium]|nr:peptide chain release factor N(5)-glutamine methyltransferase [Bacteroidales bacterium]
MLLRDLISKGTETISQAFPEREAREMVLMFLQHSIGTSRHTHILEPSYEVFDDAVVGAMSAFERMASGEPIQYIIGKAYFYDREFNVTPDVLIPRPETELLVRAAVNWARRSGRETMRIADLCTGSGCIAWSMALELPGAEVTAVDISDGALAVAAGQESGSAAAGCPCEVVAPKFIKADVLAGPVEGLGTFDMILSNPPYVMDSEKALMRKNVLEHEPWLALFVPDDDPLLFYRAVAAWARQLLKPDGLCLVEINEALGRQTAEVFEDAGFRDVEVLQDLNSRDRFVRAIQ